ncbi:MAG TPA: hypothetical protein VGJ54_08540, partial [Streptosporangiaceae bacterium]
MRTDRPDPPEGDGPTRRGAFDDLRERLARLPPGHPSSVKYGDRTEEPDRPGRWGGADERAEAEGRAEIESHAEIEGLAEAG